MQHAGLVAVAFPVAGRRHRRAGCRRHVVFRASPTRYLIGVGALALMFMSFGVTFASLNSAASDAAAGRCCNTGVRARLTLGGV